MKKDCNEYSWNLLHYCGITERTKLSKDIEGVIRYLALWQENALCKTECRYADIVMDYYNGLSQSEIGVKYAFKILDKEEFLWYHKIGIEQL